MKGSFSQTTALNQGPVNTAASPCLHVRIQAGNIIHVSLTGSGMAINSMAVYNISGRRLPYVEIDKAGRFRTVRLGRECGSGIFFISVGLSDGRRMVRVIPNIR
jgi:hypothetical protein